MNTKVLGKNIVYLRKKNDITQLILAEKIGISRKQLHNYERAKNEILNSTTTFGGGIYSRTVKVYSFI